MSIEYLDEKVALSDPETVIARVNFTVVPHLFWKTNETCPWVGLSAGSSDRRLQYSSSCKPHSFEAFSTSFHTCNGRTSRTCMVVDPNCFSTTGTNFQARAELSSSDATYKADSIHEVAFATPIWPNYSSEMLERPYAVRSLVRLEVRNIDRH